MKLNGFLGVNFGSTKENVKARLLSRPECILDEDNSDDNALFFNGIKFAGRETLFIMFMFYENGFANATVLIKPKLEAHTISLYSEIKGEINEKYFVSQEDYEIYESPYEKDDGYVETAISVGKATFSCYWTFKDEDNIEDYISLRINEDLNIVLTYENSYLMEQLVKKNKAMDSLDY